MVLYTLTYSRHLTIARGVHGIMDLTVPGGGWSDPVFDDSGKEGGRDERRELGLMKRMLGRLRSYFMTRKKATRLWYML
jgi:hypothetical protein